MEYSHVCSFRRQVYCSVNPDISNFELPESVLIEFEGESLRICLTDDATFARYIRASIIQRQNVN